MYKEIIMGKKWKFYGAVPKILNIKEDRNQFLTGLLLIMVSCSHFSQNTRGSGYASLSKKQSAEPRMQK